MADYRSDVLIIGGGIAGITVALDLLDGGKSVLMLDRDEESVFGGLARESFGGMFFVDSPEQRRQGIRDSKALALRDWLSFAQFSESDRWPRAWAEAYVDKLGWVGFDPTNGISPTEAHVRVAVSLDYLGAAPVRGTRYGGGSEALDVSVRVSCPIPGQRQSQS